VIVMGAGVLDLWLHASGSGLAVRAVGFDERSAKRGGIRTNWVRVRALLIASVLAAVAAFFVMARSPIGNAQIGAPFALNSITAAVLGGASLAGGRATFVGSTVASVLLALIITVLPFLGLTPTDGSMIIGVLVLVGIVLFQAGDLKELIKRNYRLARCSSSASIGGRVASCWSAARWKRCRSRAPTRRAPTSASPRRGGSSSRTARPSPSTAKSATSPPPTSSSKARSCARCDPTWR